MPQKEVNKKRNECFSETSDSTVSAYTVSQSSDTSVHSSLTILGNITRSGAAFTVPADGQTYYYLPFAPSDSCVIVASLAKGSTSGYVTCDCANPMPRPGDPSPSGSCLWTYYEGDNEYICECQTCNMDCLANYHDDPHDPAIYTAPILVGGSGVILPAKSVYFNGTTY